MVGIRRIVSACEKHGGVEKKALFIIDRAD